MTRVLEAFCCCLAFSALVDTASIESYFHDYVKDGRIEDGPFPSNLKNIPYYCYQAPLKGTCERVFLAYFFDVVRRQCMPMIYSGCGGNENRFDSIASCKIHCESKRKI